MQELAEMPLIGTRFAHRGKGLARRLMTVIEGMMAPMAVQACALEREIGRAHV